MQLPKFPSSFSPLNNSRILHAYNNSGLLNFTAIIHMNVSYVYKESTRKDNTCEISQESTKFPYKIQPIEFILTSFKLITNLIT